MIKAYAASGAGGGSATQRAQGAMNRSANRTSAGNILNRQRYGAGPAQG